MRALVTGASAGIGVAYAEQLAARGAHVVLVARRLERLEELARRIGGTALQADLTKRADVERVAEVAAGCDLVINNAGFGGYAAFAQLPPERADELIEVHIRSVTRLCRAALPGLIARRQGGIVNVASLLSLSGTVPPGPLPQRAVYAGAKAYLLAFTQTLAGELTGSGVRVQCCLPGRVATEFHTSQGMPLMPGAMSAGDVARASLAALDRGELVCIPGLDDEALFERIGEAQRAVLQAANRAHLAKRYA